MQNVHGCCRSARPDPSTWVANPVNAVKGVACDLVQAYARVLQRAGDAADDAFLRSGLGEILSLAAMRGKQQHSIDSITPTSSTLTYA